MLPAVLNNRSTNICMAQVVIISIMGYYLFNFNYKIKNTLNLPYLGVNIFQRMFEL